MQIDLNRYQEFVEQVTSKPSNDLTTFMNRLDELDGNFDDVTQDMAQMLMCRCYSLPHWDLPLKLESSAKSLKRFTSRANDSVKMKCFI